MLALETLRRSYSPIVSAMKPSLIVSYKVYLLAVRVDKPRVSA